MSIEHIIHAKGKEIMYIHQESFLRSSHISPQLKISFDLKANFPQRIPPGLCMISCRDGICLSRGYNWPRIKKSIHTNTYKRNGCKAELVKDTFF